MTSFTNIFGGSPIQTADVSYRRIDLRQINPIPPQTNPPTPQVVKLQWPTAFQDTNSVVSHIMEITSDNADNAIWLPDATLASVGSDFVLINISTTPFKLCYFGGDPLSSSINQNSCFYYYLTDNTTKTGGWNMVSLGASAVLTGLTTITETVDGDGLTINPRTVNGTTDPTFTFKLDSTLQSLATLNNRSQRSGAVFYDSSDGSVKTHSMRKGNGIHIENADGVAGPPTFSIDPAIIPTLGGITTLTMNPVTPSVAITGSPVNPPDRTANLTVGLHPSLEALYKLAVRGPSSSGFVTRYSHSAPYFIRRTFEKGDGILIENPDGAAGNPRFSIDPDFVSGLQSLTVTSSSSAIRVTGSPTTSPRPTITLIPDADVQALASNTTINHRAIPVACGKYISGTFINVFNVKSVVKKSDTQYKISFDTAQIRDTDKRAFFCVNTGAPMSWGVQDGLMTEASTLTFSSPDPDFDFMVWAI